MGSFCLTPNGRRESCYKGEFGQDFQDQGRYPGIPALVLDVFSIADDDDIRLDHTLIVSDAQGYIKRFQRLLQLRDSLAAGFHNV